MRSGALEGSRPIGRIPGITATPSAAVNEHRHWRIPNPRRVDVEHLMRCRPIRDSLGRSEALADELTVAAATLAHLIAIWGVDRLVVGVVKLFLVHVEPDARPLRARCGLLRSSTGRNHGGG